MIERINKILSSICGTLDLNGGGYLVHSLGADSQYRCVKFEEKKVKVKK